MIIIEKSSADSSAEPDRKSTGYLPDTRLSGRISDTTGYLRHWLRFNTINMRKWDAGSSSDIFCISSDINAAHHCQFQELLWSCCQIPDSGRIKDGAELVTVHQAICIKCNLSWNEEIGYSVGSALNLANFIIENTCWLFWKIKTIVSYRLNLFMCIYICIYKCIMSLLDHFQSDFVGLVECNHVLQTKFSGFWWKLSVLQSSVSSSWFWINVLVN